MHVLDILFLTSVPIFRFFEPDSGSISIGGRGINTVQLDSLRKNIAVVPQDSVLFHDTIRYRVYNLYRVFRYIV